MDTVKKVWRIVPDGGSISLHPPGTHDDSPILNEFTLLNYGYNRFSKKQCNQGVYDGFIGPDLRMHVLVNARDEVLNGWEFSHGRPLGCEPAPAPAHSARHGCKS